MKKLLYLPHFPDHVLTQFFESTWPYALSAADNSPPPHNIELLHQTHPNPWYFTQMLISPFGRRR
jgi:hypothetical protein